MAVPTSRDAFKQYCLRSLGKPVIEINVDDDQVEDRIDEALRYYWDYHFDGTEKTYYKHQITADTQANGYIIIPDNIIGAVNVFDFGGTPISGSDLFNIRYQIALNDMYNLTNVNLIGFYLSMQHLALIQELLVGKFPIRYNRHTNKLHLDITKEKLEIGHWLIVEAYQIVDPDLYQDVWKDPWLMKYATALIKRQWGSNLTKFSNMVLPGGVTYNGEKILDDAVAEIAKMEAEMINSYSLPVTDMIG